MDAGTQQRLRILLVDAPGKSMTNLATLFERCGYEVVKRDRGEVDLPTECTRCSPDLLVADAASLRAAMRGDPRWPSRRKCPIVAIGFEESGGPAEIDGWIDCLEPPRDMIAALDSALESFRSSKTISSGHHDACHWFG